MAVFVGDSAVKVVAVDILKQLFSSVKLTFFWICVDKVGLRMFKITQDGDNERDEYDQNDIHPMKCMYNMCDTHGYL